MLFVVVLQLMYFLKLGISVLDEILLPLFVKVPELVLANTVVFCHLLGLYALSQFILGFTDFSFQKSNFTHKFFVQRVLVNLTAFLSEKRHFLADDLEDQDLFVLIQHGI